MPGPVARRQRPAGGGQDCQAEAAAGAVGREPSPRRSDFLPAAPHATHGQHMLTLNPMS